MERDTQPKDMMMVLSLPGASTSPNLKTTRATDVVVDTGNELKKNKQNCY